MQTAQDIATCMYYTGIDPFTKEPVYVARQLQDQSAYILPVRFDDSPVPGLSETVHYLRASDFTEPQLADAIRQKLRTAKSGS